MKWSSRIVFLLVIVGLAAAIVTALRPRPIDVESAQVVVAPLEQKVTDDGRARIREKYIVSAPVAGTLARIDLNEGDVVEPGSVLARLLPLPSPLLDPRSREVAGQRVASAEDAHRQAKATLERATTAAAESRVELERNRSLVSHDAATQAQLDQAEMDARMRESEVASARFAERVAAHAIDEARAALETFTNRDLAGEQLEITSPVHGRVLHVLQKSEGVVSAGTSLIEVGDPEALELVVDVLSQDAVEVRPGLPARVLHWGGDRVLSAKVSRVEPAAFTKTSALGVDEQRVNVVLDLDGPPEQWRSLGDGFGAEIEIVVWSRPNVLQVPASALFRDGDGWATFVIRDGRAVLRQVVSGHRGAIEAEIMSGLSEGETVVVHPGSSIRDGTRVVTRSSSWLPGVNTSRAPTHE